MHKPESCCRSAPIRPSIPVLEVGQVTEQVEVQADAALVETRSTGVGTVMDNQRVLELPLNGRNVTELIFLAGMANACLRAAAGSEFGPELPDGRYFRGRRAGKWRYVSVGWSRTTTMSKTI